jgi:hypothetical protein
MSDSEAIYFLLFEGSSSYMSLMLLMWVHSAFSLYYDVIVLTA